MSLRMPWNLDTTQQGCWSILHLHAQDDWYDSHLEERLLLYDCPFHDKAVVWKRALNKRKEERESDLTTANSLMILMCSCLASGGRFYMKILCHHEAIHARHEAISVRYTASCLVSRVFIPSVPAHRFQWLSCTLLFCSESRPFQAVVGHCWDQEQGLQKNITKAYLTLTLGTSHTFWNTLNSHTEIALFLGQSCTFEPQFHIHSLQVSCYEKNLEELLLILQLLIDSGQSEIRLAGLWS